MAESPDGDKFTDGETLFSNGNTTESTAPTIAVTSDADKEYHQKGVDSVLYSDVWKNLLTFIYTQADPVDWYKHTPYPPKTKRCFGKGMHNFSTCSILSHTHFNHQDYAAFLKKRSSIEEDHANGLRRIAKSHQESIRKQEARQGSYVRQLEEVMRLHERIADNGMQFALSLHQMHEDLSELSRNIESGRKHWKHEGLNAEKRASDAEAAMEKAKAKYDSLAEDYDRARTGDAKGSRRLGLKGPKSAAQHEEDLLRKLQAADSDYQQKVQTARAQREELIRTGRPQAVKALQELITECDSGLALQLQKFGMHALYLVFVTRTDISIATFNEKLLLGNGLVISPLPPTDGAAAQRSMRDVVIDIDNEKDYHGYILGHTSKITVPQEIQYKQHPVCFTYINNSRHSSIFISFVYTNTTALYTGAVLSHHKAPSNTLLSDSPSQAANPCPSVTKSSTFIYFTATAINDYTSRCFVFKPRRGASAVQLINQSTLVPAKLISTTVFTTTSTGRGTARCRAPVQQHLPYGSCIRSDTAIAKPVQQSSISIKWFISTRIVCNITCFASFIPKSCCLHQQRWWASAILTHGSTSATKRRSSTTSRDDDTHIKSPTVEASLWRESRRTV